MSQVQNNTTKRRVIEGRPRQVINTGKIDWIAFEFTDSVGTVDVGIAAVFGKDPTTGKPHVSVINPSVIKELLSIPDPHIRDGILAAHAKMDVPAAELPEGKVGSFEIGDIP